MQPGSITYRLEIALQKLSHYDSPLCDIAENFREIPVEEAFQMGTGGDCFEYWRRLRVKNGLPINTLERNWDGTVIRNRTDRKAGETPFFRIHFRTGSGVFLKRMLGYLRNYPSPYRRSIMIKNFIYLAVMFFLFATVELDAEPIVSITFKSYSGECDGYCDTTLLLTNLKVDYTEFSTHKGDPPHHVSRIISPIEWSALTDGDAIRRFQRLPKVLGDPGEVDQVVWTLIVTTPTRSQEVRFDSDTKPSSLTSYLDELWKIDAEMTSKAGKKR